MPISNRRRAGLSEIRGPAQRDGAPEPLAGPQSVLLHCMRDRRCFFVFVAEGPVDPGIIGPNPRQPRLSAFLPFLRGGRVINQNSSCAQFRFLAANNLGRVINLPCTEQGPVI